MYGNMHTIYAVISYLIGKLFCQETETVYMYMTPYTYTCNEYLLLPGYHFERIPTLLTLRTYVYKQAERS